ncbi:hypothetical protein B0J17DRAFT_87025 [Rhizoctonia solani]|nr:hypothetical protein B0J17DRAFT_87025 [Rhizoctonia solani]
MDTPLNKSAFGIRLVSWEDDSDDEADEEHGDSMHRSSMLGTEGPHTHSRMTSPPSTPLISNILLDVLEDEAGPSEASGAHTNTSVATNTPTDLPSTEDVDLQQLSTDGIIIISAHQPVSGTTSQVILSTAMAPSQNTKTGASQASVASMSENICKSREKQMDSGSLFRSLRVEYPRIG